MNKYIGWSSVPEEQSAIIQEQVSIRDQYLKPALSAIRFETRLASLHINRDAEDVARLNLQLFSGIARKLPLTLIWGADFSDLKPLKVVDSFPVLIKLRDYAQISFDKLVDDVVGALVGIETDASEEAVAYTILDVLIDRLGFSDRATHRDVSGCTGQTWREAAGAMPSRAANL